MGCTAGEDREPGRITHRVVASHFCPSSDRIYLIADAGCNHAGSLSTAKDLISAAKDSGAHAVKFQLFKWRDVAIFYYKMSHRFELPVTWLPELAQKAQEQKIDFLCTPFSVEACDALRPYVRAWKIGSFETLRIDLLHATTDKARIISLGMTPDRLIPKLRKYLDKIRPKHVKKGQDLFMHCVSRYPHSWSQSHLHRVRRLLDRGLRVGYSDHTPGTEAAIMAYAMGVRMFEKHLKLRDDRQPETPDSGPWALDPEAFARYSRALRTARKTLTPVPLRMERLRGRKLHQGPRGRLS